MSTRKADGPRRRAALLRVALGAAQMTAAAFGLGLWAAERVTPRAVAATVAACTLTTVSILLFDGWRQK